MASFASSATTSGARKHACTKRKKKKKVGENNGQLRFVRHHGWRTQARLDQNAKINKNTTKIGIKIKYFANPTNPVNIIMTPYRPT